MKPYNNIQTRKDYDLLLKSGMFWVAYPELTGDWSKDFKVIKTNTTEHRSEINIYNRDCLEAMREMPDNAYELAIVDPPYGIGEASGQESSRNKSKGRANTPVKYTRKNWDKNAPTREYFDELFRVSKNVIVFGANHFIESIPNANSSCWIVWDKDNSGDFADCELAFTTFDTAVRKFTWRWNGMIQQDMKNKEVRIHPTQKPVKLYEWLLTNYAKEGDKILDTHGGSMSIALACWNLKFDLDLWELDPDYYEAGVKRFEQHKKQLQLF